MDITLISSVFPYPNKGKYVGIERFVLEYSRALMRRGEKVRVITTFWNGGEENEEYEGIEITRVPDSSQYIGRLGRLFDLHYYTFGKNILKYKEVLKSSDIIHAVSPIHTTAWFKENNIPIITQFHHKGEIEGPLDYLILPFHIRNEKKAYSYSDTVFTMSKVNKKVLIKEYGLDGGQIKVIPHGVDIKRFQPPIGEKEKRPVLRLLFVGALEKRKGVEYLIGAMDVVQKKGYNVNLIIVGDGDERKKLVNMAKKYKVEDSIEFKGYIENDKLLDQYDNADIFVFPSLKEGFGQVLLEAMACGLPVISTDSSAIPEIIGNEGILTEPKNPKALANAIIELIEDPKLRKKLGQMGRKRVEENFTWDGIVDQTVKVYREIIERKDREKSYKS